MTALTRLTQLLQWPNGDFEEWIFARRPPAHDARRRKNQRVISQGPEALFIDRAAIRSLVDTFIASCDGSADAGFVVAQPDDSARDIDDDALDLLGGRLHLLVMGGLDSTLQKQLELGFPTPSLRFAVRSVARQKPRWRPTEQGNLTRVGGKHAREAHRARGAYVLHAMGTTADVLLFLVGHLLTQRDMVAIQRCKREACERFVVIDLKKRGRRPEYCEPVCIELETRELQRRQRKPKRRSTR